MAKDQITEIRIHGLRTIQDLRIRPKGLTVLIGENGTGKSSILEAFELLRQAAASSKFVPDVFVRRHGGLASLLRHGCDTLGLGVTIEGAGPRITYDFRVANVGTSPQVVEEHLNAFVNGDHAKPLHALIRDSSRFLVFDERTRRLVAPGSEGTEDPEQDSTESGSMLPVPGSELALTSLGIHAQRAFQRTIEALERIDTHAPFETRPLWQQQEMQISVGPRWPATFENNPHLTRYGLNLPNALHQIRELHGSETWQRVLLQIRMGLGEAFRDVRFLPAGRGTIDVELVHASASSTAVRLDTLSEGQISYLCFVALTALASDRTLVSLDEPELHLHPALLSRVVGMLEGLAADTPVFLATHSDQLLDMLSAPADSIALCELDSDNATTLARPEPTRLEEWLQDYRGVGSLRAEGYVSHVFEREPPFSAEAP